MQMKVREDTHDVGVIVGRFQVPELHEAHKLLIQHVCDQHDKVIIFLGLSPLRVTRENPLDFESRKQMILKEFPNVNVLYVKDHVSDEVWSQKLDEMIQDVVTPAQTVVLYGGRDSFMEHYTGTNPMRELEQDVYVSGTEIRKSISKKSVKATEDFRAGVVWAAHSGYPTCYPTVDIAIFNNDFTKILLGRKPHEDKFRLIGGFADPKSTSYEADARRETEEEAGISITDPQYIGSCLVDDWRYRGEVDKIKTMVFVAKHFSGQPRPGDDIVELRWFDVDSKLEVVDTHVPLIDMVHTWLI